MDCRETQTLLTAFHDGELSAADRARAEDHLRSCPECRALLADLARADAATTVPDPGPAYWDRFNARVMDRVEREADGQRVAVLRPKHSWMRQQLRYLVPAAAAAALVVVVVRYGGLHPGAPTSTVPPAVREPAAPDSSEQRTAKAEPESDGHGRPSAGAGRDATGPVAPAPATNKAEGAGMVRRVPEESSRVAGAPAAPSPAIADERNAVVVHEERDRLAGRPPSEAKERPSRDLAGTPAGTAAPTPPQVTAYRSATAGSPPATSTDGMASRVRGEQKKMAEAADGQGRPDAEAGRDAPGSKASAARTAEPQLAAKAESASGMRIAKDQAAEAPPAVSAGKTRSKAGTSPLASAPSYAAPPCELARTLAARKRWKEAEAAQRACLAQDRSAPAQEKGLVFLAELLDRQERFADADVVIKEVDRQFPKSRPLDLYRQQRPMVQQQPTAVPVIR